MPWLGRNPQGSLSPAHGWMAHRELNPWPWHCWCHPPICLPLKHLLVLRKVGFFQKKQFNSWLYTEPLDCQGLGGLECKLCRMWTGSTSHHALSSAEQCPAPWKVMLWAPAQLKQIFISAMKGQSTVREPKGEILSVQSVPICRDCHSGSKGWVFSLQRLLLVIDGEAYFYVKGEVHTKTG